VRAETQKVCAEKQIFAGDPVIKSWDAFRTLQGTTISHPTLFELEAKPEEVRQQEPERHEIAGFLWERRRSPPKAGRVVSTLVG